MDFSLPLVTNMNFIKEEMPSPLRDQILNFCESELFPELQNSEVASSSNGCCYDEQSSYSTNFDLNKFHSTSEKNDETITTSAKPATSTTDVSPSSGVRIDNNSNNNDEDDNKNNNNYNNNLSIIFDIQEEIENDISASIDFTTPANFTVPNFLNHQDEKFDINSLNNHHAPVTDVVIAGSMSHQYPSDQHSIVPFMGPPLGHVYEEESLSSIPPYMSLTTSSPCTLLDPNLATYFQGNLNTTISSEASAIFAAAANSALFFGSQLPNQELEFQGENGRIFCPDALSRIYSCSSELQALSNESQHLASAAGCSNPLATEITSFEDSTLKNAKCSDEERREKIHRYMKKRNERNFSKKIKYACRKTLADSRPRVRGRFARNDEFGEATSKGNYCGTHEEDSSDQDVKLNIIYHHHDPNNMVASSNHLENNASHVIHNGRIFNSNCHVPSGPYDICAPLFCTDGQLH